MKVLKHIVISAAVIVVFCGCMKKLDIKPTPNIENPVVDVSSDPSEPFLAGFAAETITPDTAQWMAGYDFLRRSKGVHDGLYARALVFRQGDVKFAMVSLDLVGLNRWDVEKIKARVNGFRPDQILIACTHVHSGPDTMGMWGLPPFYTGKDEKYMEKVYDGVIAAVLRAEDAAVPVSAFTAVYQMDPNLMYNMNEGEPKDDTMGLMVFRDEEGETVATLINMTGHPEVLYGNNHVISADFPGVMYREVEKKYGGGAVLLNGALGSLISPNMDKPRTELDFDDVEAFGKKAAAQVDKGMELLEKEESPSISYRTSHIRVLVENNIYVVLQRAGIIKRHVYEGPSLITEVSVIEIGSAQFVTFPGEAYPKQGMNIRERQKPNSFQVSLANDELGYLLYPEDYNSELYEYEAGLCPGPQLAVKIEEALLELLEK